MSRCAQAGLWRKEVLAFLVCILFSATALAQNAATAPWEQYKIPLTPEEIAWVKAHPTVRHGFDPAWPPFSFRDGNGAWQGIDFELLARLSERLGIRFEPIETKSWQETEQKIRAGEVDVISGITPTSEREKTLLFTSTYITCPVAVITRQEAPFMTSLHDLKDVTLASPRNYVTTEQLMRDYPGLPIIQTANMEEAFTLVSQHKADVAIDNLPSASVTISSTGLKNLKIAGITDYHFGVSLAVPKAQPELQAILQKGLDSLDDADRRAITDHWTAVEYFPRMDWSRVWKIIGALVVLGGIALSLFIKWNRHLARELEERKRTAAQIKAANEELRELGREKDRFMTMAAHDLNNPLTAIMMKCIIFEIDGDFSRQTVHGAISTIRNNAQRMTHLIKNLLKADGLEHGSMKLRPGTFDLVALVRESVEVMLPCAECKNIRLEFTPAPAPVRIHADREALMQVLENLISNAVKFTQPGKLVAVGVSVREGFARVEVHDQGPGITADDMPQLFKKYVTLSARPTANEDSNGLGLSIAKGLVESMKGRITCESRAGEGATFIVEFPVELELASAPAPV
ncbi:MAG TPA: transporter substrate-binding domain-containing protein [Chthoniobacteraceae bacterium]|nr:transporter substrate-binding domain-containing protein [Chthoniobacteraceae bacterium]